MKFVSKPVEVDAVQFVKGETGGFGHLARPISRLADPEHFKLWVEKSDEWCDIEIGDWIITEPDGLGYYPCKQAIFAAKYDRVPADRHPVA